MKTVILYASSHGASAEVADWLAAQLGDADVINLKKQAVPNLALYDTVIVGGSIHMGRMQGTVRKLIETHAGELVSKRLGLYVCCMFEGETAQKQLEDAYPQGLRDAAVATGLLGGTFDFDRMGFMEKVIVKKVSGVTESVSRLNREAMMRFVETMKGTQ